MWLERIGSLREVVGPRIKVFPNGNYLTSKGNQSEREHVRSTLYEKVLDTIAIDTLYKTIRAIICSRSVRKKFQC
jgi:hypothetical protein